MVRALIVAARAATHSAGKLYEVAGAGALLVGAAMWAPAAAWALGGVMLLGKSLEHDLTSRGDDG